MYPTLFHAIKDLFGIELPILKVVMTYGFFMFLAFLSEYWTTRTELIRRGKNGQLDVFYGKVKAPNKLMHYSLSIILGFIGTWKLSYFIFHFQEVIDSPQEFIISLNGNIEWGIFGALLMTCIDFWDLKRKENNIKDIPIEFIPMKLCPTL